jgi:hypothetical protein
MSTSDAGNKCLGMPALLLNAPVMFPFAIVPELPLKKHVKEEPILEIYMDLPNRPVLYKCYIY